MFIYLICGNCQKECDRLSTSNWTNKTICPACKRLGLFMFLRRIKRTGGKKHRVLREDNRTIDIQPVVEIVYPNRGGSTGFSINVWETKYLNPGTYHLVSPWGGPEGSDGLVPSAFVLEARFFVFGSLLERVLIGIDSLSEALKLSYRIFPHWKPVMDALEEETSRLRGEDGRTRIHIDEIVDDELRKSVQVTV